MAFIPRNSVVVCILVLVVGRLTLDYGKDTALLPGQSSVHPTRQIGTDDALLHVIYPVPRDGALLERHASGSAAQFWD